MLIRKNKKQCGLSNFSAVCLKSQGFSQGQSQQRFSLPEFNQKTYIDLTRQDLIENIKDQDKQLRSLLEIINSYKNKILQFSRYEKIIQNICSEQQKSREFINKKQVKVDRALALQSICDQKVKPSKKIVKLATFSQFSVTFYCEHQKKTLQENRQSQNRLKKHEFFPQTAYSKDASEQNVRLFGNTAPQQHFKLKQNSGFGYKNVSYQINKPKMGISHDSMEGNSRLNLSQRLPSLQNLRRIQKCFKLLKN